MSQAKACEHIEDGALFAVDFVFDAHLHATDGLARCAVCDRRYLFEMIDIAGPTSLFRLSTLSRDAADKTIRSLGKGSCDIERGRNEIFNLASGAEETKTLYVMQSGAFVGPATRPEGLRLPRGSWRELDCDGALLREVGIDE